MKEGGRKAGMELYEELEQWNRKQVPERPESGHCGIPYAGRLAVLDVL